VPPAARVLLISSSVVYGSGYLDHAAAEIAALLGPAERVAFVPFALRDREGYARKARERFARIERSLESVHDRPDRRGAIETADVIFVGGGNTFRLLASSTGMGSSRRFGPASAPGCRTSVRAPGPSWPARR
jgi:peptidase E